MLNRVVIGFLFACAAALSPAYADDAEYFISTRSYDQSAPQYIPVVPAATADQSAPLAACDGQTYYLSSSQLDQVNAAMAANDTVQLYTAPQSASTDDASILCLFQASP